ncbi:hypothetical protein MBANPS3_008240, partial [Mucor bainieri]
MGAAFDYFASTTIDTFRIEDFLDKQKCESRESSKQDFIRFVTSINNSKSKSEKMLQAKKIAKYLIQNDFDILLSGDFVDYWTDRERAQTRSIRRATNTRAALDQANTVYELFTTSAAQNMPTTSQSATSASQSIPATSQSTTSASQHTTIKDTISSIVFSSDDSSSSVSSQEASSQDSQKVNLPTHLYYLNTTEGKYERDRDGIKMRWISSKNFDISDSFLDFRDRCISRAEDLETLDPYEQLALDGIMVIDDDICAERYLPFEAVETMLEEINATQRFQIPAPEAEMTEICQAFEHHMKKRRVEDTELEAVIAQWKAKYPKYNATAIQTVLTGLRDTYTMNYSVTSNNEATLVRDTLDIFFKAFFRNTPLKRCLGADCMIRSSSKRYRDMDPSLSTHGKRADFSIVSVRDEHLLLALEAKRIGASKSGDFIKIAKELKDSLKGIGLDGYTDVAVVGLLLEGHTCKVFVMDHVYDFMYRMVLIDKWYLPQDRYNMSCVQSILSTMRSLKSLTDTMARTLNKPSTLVEDEDNHLPLNMMSFHTPTNIRIEELGIHPDDPKVKNARRKLDFKNLSNKNACLRH